jgi:cytoskeletal protein CcmA (bactofilin family)
MGKNPPEKENQPATNTQDVPGYSTPRSYQSYPSGDSYVRPTTEQTSGPKAMTESETLAREIKEGTLSGFVGSGTDVTGELTFKAMLRVDGHLSGRITSSTGTLVVGSGGHVEANIEVAVATVHGLVNGDIVASQRVELGRSAKVSGNIQTSSLVIEQGAVFEGSCKMIQQKAALEKDKKIEKKEEVFDVSRLKAVPVEHENKKPEIVGVQLAAHS